MTESPLGSSFGFPLHFEVADSHFVGSHFWNSWIPTSLLEVALEVEESHFAGAQFRTEAELIERGRDLSEERKILQFGVSENEPLGRFL